jgi:ATP-binding cassette subfamily C (CFTR/MRP) protein 1
MTVIFRGLVVSLIYDKALQHPLVSDDLPAVTLVSADIEQIRNALMYASEICFVVVELGIGIGLLWRQLGPVALAPLLITAITGSINTKLARIQGARRKPLFEATQKRVGLASAILGAMKSIKLGGLSQAMAYRLQNERRREMGKASSVRWLTVWQNTVGKDCQGIDNSLSCITNQE